ncbi:MAG: DNA helicase RecQ [Chlorobi bacterium]|nr:DNA helicase RecQ [Chlorobiota bacterium]
MADENILLENLRKYFGYGSFRPLQKEIINDVLEGRDIVVLMPTGGGKSICYQLPSVLMDGITLVVSPLIALMKDQVQSLRANGIDAVFLNSTLTQSDKRTIVSRINSGEVKLLYVAPETIFSGDFVSFLKTLKLNLIAIDEAHCVSSWGHHFRPEYSKLHILKEEFPDVPTMALTATADRAVRSDIGELLGMKSPEMFISSFDRPNLSLSVLPGQKKWEQIIRIVNRHNGESGIIYCGSRKATETLAAKLQREGVKAESYHAGMNSESRGKVQDMFIQGDTDVICATIAFGMGIDKPDIRFVIHYNMPGNIESYYQEIGRAGRDGQPAETILFYSYRDVQTHMGFIEEINNEQYKKIQIAKLNRMQEYAEAQVCRRKILLSYFSETLEDDCGNCDVCKNPPRYFDGTILAQMALSAVARTNEQISVSTLVDILKGVYSRPVTEKSFQKIKTFGVGKDTTAFAWQLYIQQFIQQGLVEIDYKDHYNLKLNELSHKVLKKELKVKLVDYEVIKQRKEEQSKAPVKKLALEKNVNETLYEHLKEVRTLVAKERGVRPYLVFSNESLRDMSSQMPADVQEFMNIHGVGEHKAKMYGKIFLKAIAEFNSGKSKGDTYKITYEMLKNGMTVSEIAKERNIQETTIYSHIAHLLKKDSDIDVFEFITKEELNEVKNAKQKIVDTTRLKPYFEHFNGKIPYGKIRIALSYLDKI